jgi:type IX secretion system PorP/SprF family membrane protein
MNKTLLPLFISFLLILFTYFQTTAQQLPLFSEYLHNAFTLNPALMGWENITAASLSYRQQWTGMPNAPKTATLSYQNFDNRYNMGYGAYFMNDQTGPTSFTGLNLAYGYQLKMNSEKIGLYNRNRLCLGLSLAAQVYRLRGRDLLYNDADDELIINANQSKILPDAGIGMMYFNDLYYVSASVPQIISMKVKYNKDNAISNLRRSPHFYLSAGAKIEIQGAKKDKHFIIPSFWFKFAPMSPINFTANVRYLWNYKLLTGIGFSSDGGLLFDASFNLNKQYRLGYAFSVPVNGLAQYLGTNHELIFTYIIQSNGKGWFFEEVKNTLTKKKDKN